jgi:enoyl-CoA hydratase
MKDVLQIENDEGITTVRINRPEHRNVLSIALMRALTETARQLHDADDVRAVILTGAGPHFSAGADLKDPRRWQLDQGDIASRRALPYIGERMCQAWEEIPAVTICAIEGHCIGGGAALAICADFRVVGTSGYLHFPEVALGLPLSWGALPRLVRMLGPVKAKQAVVLCEKFAGRQAVELGIADYLAADGETYREALALARKAAALPSLSVRMGKEAINVTSNALNKLASFMARDQLALAAHGAEAVAIREKFSRRTDSSQ